MLPRLGHEQLPWNDFLLTSRRNHFLAVGVIGRNDVSNKSVAPCIPAPIVKIPDVLKSVSIMLWLPLTSHRLRSTSGGSTSQPPAVCKAQVLPRVCRVTMPLQPPAVCGAKVLPRVRWVTIAVPLPQLPRV